MRQFSLLISLLGATVSPIMAQIPEHAPPSEPAPPVAPATTDFPAPKIGDVSRWGTNIQRTMRLLATSTPQHHNKVRILFYGQSITEQEWSKQVADDLRRRFPNADLEIENRAIGGFASQILHKTAYFDLYPFYPDLMIFHVYGSHIDYETIIRETRQRTTSEILLQTDHITKDEELSEETDPAKLNMKNWTAWWNAAFLPEIALRYGVELADVRSDWKNYLRENHLQAKDLLKDGVHLNAHGNFVMAHLVSPHLRFDPKFTAPQNLTRDYVVRRDLHWQNGKLVLPFTGSRIDVIAAPNDGNSAAAQIRIDGKKPSQLPELTVFTRPSGTPNVGWPGIIRLTSQTPLVPETWTARVTQINDDASQFSFDVTGSVTGFDGSGQSDQKFVSKSGRVLIEPEDWWPRHDWELSKKPTPVGWQTNWRAIAQFMDEYQAPKNADASRETVTTLAQGLENGPHTLEIIGDKTPIECIRVYQPPMK